MSIKSLVRTLEIMATLNENTVTIPMVRDMAEKALKEHCSTSDRPHQETDKGWAK